MLSVAQDLANSIAPYQAALSTALNAATQLPLVGKQLTDLSEFTTILQNLESNIAPQTQNIVSDGHYQVTVGLPGLSKTFGFNLGLDAFLQATAVGNVQVSVNPTLYVGFDFSGGNVSLDLGQTRFDIGFGISLPGFQGTFSFNGLLFAKAVDQGTNFNGVLGFGFAGGGGLNPQFSGNAHVLMGLSLSFVDPALDVAFNPVFRTTLDMNWGFGANNQLAAPSIQLVNMGLEADSFLDGFLGDVVKTVQKFTKPVQPLIDIFQTPMPIVSSFGSHETIGSLLQKSAGESQQQQDRFDLLMQIITAVNTIDLSGGAAGAVIPLGTVSITGNAQQSGAFGFNTSQITAAIDDIFNNSALQVVEDALRDVGNYAGFTSQAGFRFPLLENPGPVLGAILTGQTETMFSFTTGRQHFELAPSIGVGVKDLFGVFLTAGIIFDANLTMGYDTAGLVALTQDPNHDPARLLHGFYFDNSIDATAPPIPNHLPLRQTGLYLQGLMEISASAGATVSGGLYADIDVELVNTDASNHVHLDTMLTNLSSSARAFKPTGKVYASADLSLTLPNPVGPDITLFSYNLGYDELVNFDPPPPPDFGVPVTVIDVTNQHTLLLDVNKMATGSRAVTVQPFHNLSLTSGGNTFEADGIRVDYPSEIYFFVERKNDVTTNYYNLVGLNGASPDGVSVNVIDPFRVFVDEGAPDPVPTQTKEGVLLTGGRNVLYKYTEGGDGTAPHVLLAGGYGSNTLSGGSMVFGNFIPADRIAQAKSHFGNLSGYDAAGQGLVNSVIDAAIAPANPAGIIGATMTARQGGLMLGGPGNNSFFAAGPGNYEMIGGTWVNSFNISPSFPGGNATYQIDGGPGGDAALVVNVPAGNQADFENGTVADKYRPQFKALDVYSNAGLFTTAHGITRVLAYGAPGSTIVFGDTSELDIKFSARGAGQIKFGGSPAPDTFDVSARYSAREYFRYGTRNHRVTRFMLPPNPNGMGSTDDFNNGLQGFTILEPDPIYLDGPIYSISRTFGTNNRTQVIDLNVGEVDSTSLTLDGRGANDQYHIALGLGTFLDITVDDTDETTENALIVDARQTGLLYDRATLTDDKLRLEYYTSIQHIVSSNGQYWFHNFMTSVTYKPTIHFDDNTDITFAMATLIHTIVDRPTAPQHASILVDGVATEDNAIGFMHTYLVYDPEQPNPTLFTVTPAAVIDVQTNAGNLSVDVFDLSAAQQFTFNVYSNTGTLSFKETLWWAGYYDTYNIFGNSGTLNIEEYISSSSSPFGYILGLTHIVNVLANNGTINLHDYLYPTILHFFSDTVDAQVNVGGGTRGLADVHGTINLSNARVLLFDDPDPDYDLYSVFGRYGLSIDDRNNPGTGAPWLIDFGKTQVGDLTVNHLDKGSPGKYEAFTKPGSSVTIYDFPKFNTRLYNGGSFPTLAITGTSGTRVNKIGDVVNLQLTASGNQGQAVAWAAANLPPGLSINQSGLISGTIAPQSSQAAPYGAVVTITAAEISRPRTISWYVISGISGDYDGDSLVGQSDYGVWRSDFGKFVTPFALGDGSGNGRIDAADYVLWRKNLPSAGSGAGADSTMQAESAAIASSLSSRADTAVFLMESSAAEITPTLMASDTRELGLMTNRLVGFEDQVPTADANNHHAFLKSRTVQSPTSHDDGLLAWLASQKSLPDDNCREPLQLDSDSRIQSSDDIEKLSRDVLSAALLEFTGSV